MKAGSTCIFREDLPRVVDIIDSAFAAQARELQAEFRIVKPGDGALKWMEARSVIFYDPRGRAVRVVGVNVDVSERKRALAQLRAFTETLEEAVNERTRELEAENEARKKAEELLRQAQKMEAVGQLTGGVAHDFNNLLTIVAGRARHDRPASSRTLETSTAVSRIVRGKDMALEGVRRAARLTNRLLAFARQQPLAPKADRCQQAGRRHLRASAPIGRRSVSLETVLAGGLWRTLCRRQSARERVAQSRVNARDAMPEGGKITIETANCYLDEAYVERAGRAGDGRPVCHDRRRRHRRRHGPGHARTRLSSRFSRPRASARERVWG